jgi:carboxyl-terminal processing protease
MRIDIWRGILNYFPAKQTLQKKIILFIALSILLPGCEESAINPFHSKDSQFVNQSAALFETMKLWYLWNNELPAVLPESYYNSVETALEYLRYKEIDKWSFVIPAVTAQQYFEEGVYYGFGISLQWDDNDHLRIVFVYKDSDAYQQNISRGCQILSINDIPVSSLSDNLSDFLDTYNIIEVQYIDLQGDTLTATLAKKEINIDYILHESIITINSKNIGYLVYNSFNINSVEDLNQAFSNFKNNNVDDLILDMRYNPGGRASVAVHLASLVIDNGQDQVFYTTIHNDGLQFLNQDEYFTSQPYSLGLNRVFIITTSSTASASELVINGLDPYIQVILIGETTSGKPVGMYSFYFGSYAFFPVSLKTVNANGDGDYYNGIEVNRTIQDDLTHDFGDNNEACLAEALSYIENGSFTLKASYVVPKLGKKKIKFTGFRAEISAF